MTVCSHGRLLKCGLASSRDMLSQRSAGVRRTFSQDDLNRWLGLCKAYREHEALSDLLLQRRKVLLRQPDQTADGKRRGYMQPNL